MALFKETLERQGWRRALVLLVAATSVLLLVSYLTPVWVIPANADHSDLYVVCPSPIAEGDTDHMQVRWPGYRGIGVTVFTYQSGSHTADGSDFVYYTREKMKGDSDSDTLWVPAVTKQDSVAEHDETFKIGFWVSGLWHGCLVTILDDDAPVVQSVEITSQPVDGDTYRTGETVDVTVAFDQEVEVGDDAHIILELGAGDDRSSREAEYHRGAGSTSLTFAYDVKTEDRDSDGVGVSGAVVDSDRNPVSGFGGQVFAEGTDVPVDMTHPGLVDAAGHGVDGRPYVMTALITSTPDSGGDAYRAGENLEVTVTFDNPVEVTGEVGVGLYVGLREENPEEAWRGALYQSGSGTDTLVFAYTIKPGDNDAKGVKIAPGGSTTGFFGSGTITSTDADVAQNPHYRGTGHLPGHKVDTDPPAISSLQIVTRPKDRQAYRAGEVVNVAVVFTEYVTYRGDLQLELDIGGEGRTATLWNEPDRRSFPSGSRFSDTMVFEYLVVEGDLAYDGIAIGADKLNLNEGSIEDPAGNPSAIDHDDLPADATQKVITGPPDVTPPTVSSIAITSDPGEDNTYGKGDLIEVTVTFSEEVRINGSPQLDLDFDGVTRTAAFSTSDRDEVIFTYTVTTGDTDSDGIAIGENKLVFNFGMIKDPAGNDATLTHNAVPEDPRHKVNAPT